MFTSITGFNQRISSVNINNKYTKAGQIFVIPVDQSSDSFAISCFQRNSALLLKTSLLLDCWTPPTPSTASIDQRLNSWR